MSDDTCPLCKGNGAEILDDGRDYFVSDGKSDRFCIHYCANCHIGYSTPPLADEELAQYYPDDFEAFVPKKSYKAYLQRLKYKDDLKIIKKNGFGENSSIFEVGAGRGEFLAEAKKLGYLVEGAEPGSAGRRYAMDNFGIRLSDEWAANIVYNKKYDVIILRHVLAHLGEPLNVLKHIMNNGLRPGGLLFLKLPRSDSWEARLLRQFWDGYDLPRHRIHYTREGILSLLNSLGFENVRARGEIVPLYLMRGIQYYGSHGSSVVLKWMAKAFSCLPYMVRFAFCQCIVIMLLPLGTGRMIVEAKKQA